VYTIVGKDGKKQTFHVHVHVPLFVFLDRPQTIHMFPSTPIDKIEVLKGNAARVEVDAKNAKAARVFGTTEGMMQFVLVARDGTRQRFEAEIGSDKPAKGRIVLAPHQTVPLSMSNNQEISEVNTEADYVVEIRPGTDLLAVRATACHTGRSRVTLVSDAKKTEQFEIVVTEPVHPVVVLVGRPRRVQLATRKRVLRLEGDGVKRVNAQIDPKDQRTINLTATQSGETRLMAVADDEDETREMLHVIACDEKKLDRRTILLREYETRRLEMSGAKEIQEANNTHEHVLELRPGSDTKHLRVTGLVEGTAVVRLRSDTGVSEEFKILVTEARPIERLKDPIRVMVGATYTGKLRAKVTEVKVGDEKLVEYDQERSARGLQYTLRGLDKGKTTLFLIYEDGSREIIEVIVEEKK
jgi:hypothetical protein